MAEQRRRGTRRAKASTSNRRKARQTAQDSRSRQRARVARPKVGRKRRRAGRGIRGGQRGIMPVVPVIMLSAGRAALQMLSPERLAMMHAQDIMRMRSRRVRG